MELASWTEDVLEKLEDVFGETDLGAEVGAADAGAFLESLSAQSSSSSSLAARAAAALLLANSSSAATSLRDFARTSPLMEDYRACFAAAGDGGDDDDEVCLLLSAFDVLIANAQADRLLLLNAQQQQSTTAQRVARIAAEIAGKDLRLLGAPLFPQRIGPRDAEAVARAAALLRSDFAARRSAMLKRFAVTLQAFLWSPRGREHEAELRALSATLAGSEYDESGCALAVEDALLAHAADAVLPRIGSGSKGRRTLAQFVMPAGVPDRGGRPLEPRTAGRARTFAEGRKQQQTFQRGARRRGGRQQPPRASVEVAAAPSKAPQPQQEMPSQAAVRAAIAAQQHQSAPQQQPVQQQQQPTRGRVQGGWGGGGGDFSGRRGGWGGKRGR